MPSCCMRWRRAEWTATCSWVEVMTSSPRLSGRPWTMTLTPSVAPPIRPRSSLRQVSPRARASFSLTSCQGFSSCPALGARSSALVNSKMALITGSGHEPRPPKLRKVQPGSRMNWPRMRLQKASSSPPAAAARAMRSASGAEAAEPGETGNAASTGVEAAATSLCIKGSPATPPASPADILRNSFLFMFPS